MPADVVNAQDGTSAIDVEQAPTPSGTPAPEPGDLPPGAIERIRSQELVDEAIRPAEDASARGVPGFAQLVIAGNMAGEIWWKNPPREILAMEGTTASGVSVTVVRVAYSDEDFLAAMALVHSHPSADLPQCVQARPNHAYDGVELGFLPEIYKTIDRPALAKKYAAIVGMPVALYETEGATKL